MDFELTEEQKMLKTNARDFLEKEIAPVADEYDSKGPMTKESAVDFIRQLIPFGYAVGPLAEEYGGSMLDHKSNGVLIEELSRAWAGLAGVVFIAGGFWQVLAEAGSPEQKDRLLPVAASGDFIGCAAITEPNAGSDAASIETTAALDGDEYVVNGTKIWISNGSIADAVLVLAVTDKSKGPLGMSFVLVEKGVSPFGARELHKLGLRAFPTAELSFVDCRIPKDNLVEPGTGYRRTILTFVYLRLVLPSGRSMGVHPMRAVTL